MKEKRKAAQGSGEKPIQSGEDRRTPKRAAAVCSPPWNSGLPSLARVAMEQEGLMESRGMGLLIVLLLLVLVAGAVLVREGRSQDQRHARAETFHHLTGGVGFGPALDLSRCAFGFDPRLDGSCAEEDGPVPGGACFCPRHAGSLFCYPLVPREEGAHASPP